MLDSLLELAGTTLICPAVDAATFSGDRAKCPESVDKGINVGVPVFVLQVHAKTDLEMFISFFETSSIVSTYRCHQSGYESHFFFESQE